MKPTKKQLAQACDELGAIRFFPTDSGARGAVARALGSFVGEAHQLRWLIDTAIDHMREWGGVPELRGLYCTRFKPADGVEETCRLTGFTPADNENAYIDGLPVGRETREERALVDRQALRKLLDGGKPS